AAVPRGAAPDPAAAGRSAAGAAGAALAAAPVRRTAGRSAAACTALAAAAVRTTDAGPGPALRHAAACGGTGRRGVRWHRRRGDRLRRGGEPAPRELTGPLPQAPGGR